MMFSHSKATPTNRQPKKAGIVDAGGLPINHNVFATTSTDLENNDSFMRHIDCQSSSIVISIKPTLIDQLSNKRLLPVPAPEERLKLGPNDTSLIDDDDDLVDYFVPPAKSSKSADNNEACTSSRSDGLMWDVKEHQVPTLPAFYPLEQSSVIVPKASPSTLATRITNVLQARSITASYDESNAKVDCISRAQVEFRVRMYRGRGKYQNDTIVEVQRLYGFDLSYIQDVYAILDAAKGDQICHVEEYGTVIAKSMPMRPSLQSFARSA